MTEPKGTYVALINVPGYLPTTDDSPTFDTAQEAWEYLAQERESAEEDMADDDPYSRTFNMLHMFGNKVYWEMDEQDTLSWLRTHGLEPDGCGAVQGRTPGYEGDHDLGIAYSVQLAE